MNVTPLQCPPDHSFHLFRFPYPLDVDEEHPQMLMTQEPLLAGGNWDEHPKAPVVVEDLLPLHYADDGEAFAHDLHLSAQRVLFSEENPGDLISQDADFPGVSHVSTGKETALFDIPSERLVVVL